MADAASFRSPGKENDSLLRDEADSLLVAFLAVPSSALVRQIRPRARQLAATTSDRVIPVCVFLSVSLEVGWRRARFAWALPRCGCVPDSRLSVYGLLPALEIARFITFAGVVVGA